MTVRRASFFALIGLVFAFWYAAVGCNLDATGYGDVNGEPCTVDVHCDDGNACTLDECNADGVCIHTAEPDGTLPDGVKGNCKILECNGGVETEVYLADDVDDGNDCTDDDCSESLGATHTPKPGSPCNFKGGLGVCDGDGVCNAKCGYIGDDGNEVGCAPSENECSPSYCDKSKGICVTESLDGVPVPGSNPATDCGGSFCVAGVAEDQFAAAGAPCVGMTGGTQGTVCDGQGACVECVTAANCNPDDHTMGFCFTAMCVNNTCMVDAKDDGTVLPDAQQKMGDCQEKRCFGFEAVDVPLNSDLPEDNNDCTFNVCTNGVPTNPPTPANTGCGLNGALFCDGAGQCSDCVSAGQCGVDTDCLKWACTNNTCQMNFEADNTPLPAGKQTAGDCLLTVCNGAGNTKNIPEDGDLPNDNNDCTSNQCMNGTQVFPPVSAGATCLGNRVCDMSGNCLGGACLGAGDCPGGAPCVDGVCCNSACNTVCEACTIALKGSGLQGQCGVSMPGTNSPNDCPNPKVCNGMTGAAACKLPVGQACSLGSECLLGFCTDGVCCGTPCGGVCEVCNAAGTCSNIPNGQDPDNECPGVVNCSGLGTCGNLLPNGTACSMASECQSNNCVDGVCCNVACGGNCQACNLGGAANGTCTNIPKEQDPANECAGALVCDGMGACKSPQGTTCGAASNCASGFCVDGVCCDTVCGTTCKACNLAGNVGTCTNIANGQDPANECPGATSCGGSGSCVLFTNGTPCATGTECSSGNCVDGVCCNTGCGTACKACNLAGNTGTCTNITSGQDPANECNGAQVCNGAGACQGGPNGASCAMASECLSGNCVDGVCCNTSCGGTCKACNLGGNTGTCTNIANGQDPANECPGATSCNGGGSCALLANGASCAAGAECTSGNCIDGVCCGTTCTGTCQACNVSGSAGTCTPVPAGDDPANECVGGDCNGAGACEAANGVACTQGTQCISGNCIDGVCCNSTCTGTCKACNVSGSVGTCANVPNGQDPATECPGVTTCDGAGACALLPQGAMCSAAGECANGLCVDGYCCDTACSGSTCIACDVDGFQGVCTDIVGSDPDNECPGTEVCAAPDMCLEIDGGACAGPADCLNGNCFDNICCESACSGLCQSCLGSETGGMNGVCALVTVNTDPRDDCTDPLVCDNMGACVTPP